MKVANDELIERALAGDREAMGQLVECLDPLVLSSIRKYLYRPWDFEDLAQEGRLLILNCLEDFDPGRGVHFLGYVKVQLKYLYLNKARERVPLSLDYELEDGLETGGLLASEEDIEEDLLVREDLALLREAMEGLTPLERDIIQAFYIEGRSMKDIAQDRGSSYRTVVNNKARAVKKLKEGLVTLGYQGYV